MIIDLTTTAQRWSHRRATWRPLRDPFDPTRFRVGPIHRIADARNFIHTHHYSASFPVALACYGLYEHMGCHRETLAGVIIFSVPVQPRAAAAYGAGTTPFCDLGRFVLAEHVGGNAETWTLKRALALFAREHSTEQNRPRYPLVIAYSDPLPRTDAEGRVQFQGHYGGIYREKSGLYLGRSTSRTIWLTRNGTTLSDRALSKFRTGDRGAGYAYAQMIRSGAPSRATGEEDAAYVARALREGPFRRVRHRGNHVYAFTVGCRAECKTLAARLHPGGPYPSRTDPVAAPTG